MKNIKTKLLSVSAAALVASSFSSAAVQQLNNTWYAITYSAFFDESKYGSSQPLDISGIPDGRHLVEPTGTPSYGSVHGIPSTPVQGTGFLNVATGEIRLDPVAWESIVTSGSYGFADWSQTLKGSFSGNVFSMSQNATATVNSGTLLCEYSTSSSCTGKGGLGSLAPALKAPQLYTPVETDEDGNVLTPETFVHVNSITFSGPIAEGVTGQYLYQNNVAPAYEDTTINITVGKVVYLPVPAAAWLFGPSLLALVTSKRFRSQEKNKAR